MSTDDQYAVLQGGDVLEREEAVPHDAPSSCSDNGEGTAVRREAASSCFCRRLCSCFRRGSEGQPVATNCPRSGFRFYVSIGRASSWLLLQEEEGYLVLLAGGRTSCSISSSGGGSVQETAEH